MRKLLLFAVLAFASVSGASELQSLDEASKGLLNDPKVLAELGITRAQFARAEIRKLINPMKALVKIVSELDDAADVAAAMVQKGFSLTSDFGLKVSELEEAQVKRLRQIFMVRSPLNAIRTKEVVFALSLSSEQLAQLEAIAADRKEVANETYGASKKLQDLEETLGALNADFKDKNETDSAAALLQMFDKMEAVIVPLMVEMMEISDKVDPEFDREALAVLTKEQMIQYEKLAGGPIKASR